jgi:cell cycle checkpoint control protein RAD9A
MSGNGMCVHRGKKTVCANNRTEVLRQPLQTSVAMDKLDFDDFGVEEKIHIGTTVRDFRSIVTHAESLMAVITTNYSHPGKPLRMAYTEHGMQCEFILMTIGEYRGGSVTPAPVGGRGMSRLPRAVQPAKPLDEGPSRRPPQSMPPPPPPASRSFVQPASQQSAKPLPPPPKASVNQESLFLDDDDDDGPWEERDYEKGEDQVGWEDSGANVS